MVLGTGNLLMGDDGFGIHAVRALRRRYRWPPTVELVDGGTDGLGLLRWLERASHLLILDCADTGAQPGALACLKGDELPAAFATALSPHALGLPEALALARWQGALPEELVLIGAQPATVRPGMELSPPLAAALPLALRMAVEVLRRWGVAVHPREGPGKGGTAGAGG
ncbi:MAG: HyaD/HybD family hydrogenase maturation endopeptidase [Firmicutes bacterium]|nr:HyaD/HybD family hydrogenase maturation endopeptidase [Bacillota bacterium]